MHPHKENVSVLSFLPSPSPIFSSIVFLLDLSRKCRGAWEVITNIRKLYYAFFVKYRDFQKNIRVTLMCVCVQSLSHVWCLASPQTVIQPGSSVHGILQARILAIVWSLNHTDCSMPGFPVLHYLPEFPQTRFHWVSGTIQPSHSLLRLLFLPSTFPSIRVFFKELALCIRWPKY